jgi:hypothetical protein
MSKKLARRLDMARDLEQRGHLDHAAKAYLRAARPDEAARLFESLGRAAEAADAWVASVGLVAREVSPSLPPEAHAVVERACELYRTVRRDADASALEAALGGRGAPFPVASLEEDEERPTPGDEARPGSERARRPSSSPAPRGVASSAPTPTPAPSAPTPTPAPSAPTPTPAPSPPFAAPSGARPTSVGAARPPAPPVDPLDIAGAPRRPSVMASPGLHRPTRPPLEESVGLHRGASTEERVAPETPRRPSSFTVARPLGRPSGAPPRGVDPRAEPEAPATPPAPSVSEPRVDVAPSAPRGVEPSSRSPRGEPSSAPQKVDPTPRAGGVSDPSSRRSDSPVAIEPPSAPKASTAPSRAPSTPGAAAPRLSAPPSKIAPTRGPVGAPEKGDFARAAGWRDMGSAEMEKTIDSLLAQGKTGAAARVALEAGQHERALVWFTELELFHHAGMCLRALGRPDEALTVVLRLSLGDSRYRRACFDVIELAREVGRFDFEVDRFLTRFVVDGPADPQENTVFLELAALYAQHGFPEGARRCAAAVLRASPDDVGARLILATHETETRPTRRSSRPPRPAFSANLPSLDAYRELVRAHAPKA